MTGKYNHRNWRFFGILDPKEKTFGHAMQRAGYSTGIFGKWQLQSYDPPDLPGVASRRGTGLHPKDAGFDEYALFHALHTEDKGSRYANPTMLEVTAGDAGELKTYPGKYGEDIWVEKILDFFKRKTGKPKFVYYPMALPHWPFEPTPDSDDWDPNNTPEADVKYQKDMIEYMDTVVGRLVEGLEKQNQRKNTIVIFYSDNGTHQLVTSEMRDGRQIQGGKATSQQTGVHVPLIVNCPGRFQAGVTDAIIDATDFFPTLLEFTGRSSGETATRQLDGISFEPVLTGRDQPQREIAFFWYDPRPGWDKEAFRRSVFAINKTHKFFRDGRLLRLGASPLSERLIAKGNWNPEDEKAARELQDYIKTQMNGTIEPPLVDAYGKPTQDLPETIRSMN